MMKNKMTKILGLGIILAAFSTGVNAQSSDNDVATATAVIVAPITITKTADLHFGDIVASAAGGTVLLTPGNVITPTGVTIPPTAIPHTVAAFNVTGTGTYGFDIDLPVSIELTNGTPADDMTVDNFVSSVGTSANLVAGALPFTVGATLTVNAAQPAGTYTNTADFVVTVTYN